MYTGVLILAAALAPADPLPPTDGVTPPEKAELVDEIEGEWEVVSLQWKGKDLTEKMKGGRLAFTHDRAKLTIADRGRSVEWAYRLDRSTPTPGIDLTGPGGGVTRGIFACTGDGLTWAESDKPGGPRPKALSSEAGSGVRVWTLRRVK